MKVTSKQREEVENERRDQEQIKAELNDVRKNQEKLINEVNEAKIIEVRLRSDIEEFKKNQVKLVEEVSREKADCMKFRTDIDELQSFLEVSNHYSAEKKSLVELLQDKIAFEVQREEEKSRKERAVSEQSMLDTIAELRGRVSEHESKNQSSSVEERRQGKDMENQNQLNLQVQVLSNQLAESIKRREEDIEEISGALKESKVKCLQLAKDKASLSQSIEKLEDRLKCKSQESVMEEENKLMRLRIKELENSLEENTLKDEGKESKHELHNRLQAAAESAQLSLSQIQTERGELEIEIVRIKQEYLKIAEEVRIKQQTVSFLEENLLSTKQALSDCVNQALMSGDRDIADAIADLFGV